MPQRYEMMTTANGQKILARVSNGVTAQVIVPNDPVISTEPIKATRAEFVKLFSKAHTHDLVLDKKTQQLTAVSRTQKPGKKAS